MLPGKTQLLVCRQGRIDYYQVVCACFLCVICTPLISERMGQYSYNIDQVLHA